MAKTQIRLDTQAQNATLTPDKVSVVATDDFSFPRDVSAGRDLKVTDGNRLVLGNSDGAWFKYDTGYIRIASPVSFEDGVITAQDGANLNINLLGIGIARFDNVANGGPATGLNMEGNAIFDTNSLTFSLGSSISPLTTGQDTPQLVSYSASSYFNFADVDFSSPDWDAFNFTANGDPNSGIGIVFTEDKATYIGRHNNNLGLFGAPNIFLKGNLTPTAKVITSDISLMASNDRENNVILIDASAGDVTVTLNLNSNGWWFFFKRIDSTGNAVTISAPTDLIDGATSYSLTTQYQCVELLSDYTTWQILGTNSSGGSMSFPILAPTGTNGAPSYSFAGYNSTGMWLTSDGNGFNFDQNTGNFMNFNVQGSNVFYIAPGGLVTTNLLQVTAGLFVQGTQSVDFNNNLITNVADPVNPQDAATKAYVDSQSGGGGGMTGEVDTSGIDTETVLTIPTETDKSLYFEVVVIGVRTGGGSGSVDDTTIAILKNKYKNVGGTVSLFGTDSKEIDYDNNTTDVNAVISGTNILIQVLGANDNQYHWTATTIFPTSGGGGGVTYPLLAPDGSDPAPSYSFASDPGTGMRLGSTGQLSFGTEGVQRVTISSDELNVQCSQILMVNGNESTPAYSFDSDSDTGFYRVTTNIAGLTAGGTQTWQFASTYTEAYVDLLVNNGANLKVQNAGYLQLQDTAVIRNTDGDEINPSYMFDAHAGWGMYYDIGFSAIGMSTGSGKSLTLDNTGALTLYQGAGGYLLDGLMKLWSDNQAVYLDNQSSGRGGAPLLVIRDSSETVFYNLNDSSLDMVSKPIINVSDPTNPQDAATKAYVDANSGGSATVATVTTASYTAAADHIILANATSNAITVNLPAASGNSGMQYVIKKIDSSANTVTIDGNASETIDGVTTYVETTQYESLTIVCDGSNWFII